MARFVLAIVGLGLSASLACEQVDPAQLGESGASASSDGGTPTDLPPLCAAAALEPGLHRLRLLEHDGEARSYDLYVPAGYTGSEPTPLVLNFHGLLGNPLQQADRSGFNAVADDRGLLVAYPQGIERSFNAGVCCGEANALEVDDVGFARALVADVSVSQCVDSARIYATGMSNGGHMVHTLACEAADLFAAVASVSGVLGTPPEACAPAAAVSVIDVHGSDDPQVAFGGMGPGFPPVEEMMAAWAERAQCGPMYAQVFAQGDARCERWSGCSGGASVELCTVEGGGHCWPGYTGLCLFGEASASLDGSAYIADFFLAHAKP